MWVWRIDLSVTAYRSGTQFESEVMKTIDESRSLCFVQTTTTSLVVTVVICERTEIRHDHRKLTEEKKNKNKKQESNLLSTRARFTIGATAVLAVLLDVVATSFVADDSAAAVALNRRGKGGGGAVELLLLLFDAVVDVDVVDVVELELFC